MTRDRVGQRFSPDTPNRVGQGFIPDTPNRVGQRFSPDTPNHVGQGFNPDTPNHVGQGFNPDTPNHVGQGFSPDTPNHVGQGFSPDSSERTRWITVAIFGLAMGWFEAACVLYLRTLVDRVEPYQANPLPIQPAFGNVELWREASTLIMLAAVGMLAGRTWRRRAGYAALAFGIWDIFYYVFLRVMCGWPRTLLDWDVLFLLPLPWWGPVLAPVCIALLMVVWGTLVTQTEHEVPVPRWAWALGWIGIVIALAVFMSDAWRALPGGRDAVVNVLPTRFNWPLFGVALALMASPVIYHAIFLFTKKSADGVIHPSSGRI